MNETNAALDHVAQRAALTYIRNARRSGVLAEAGPVFWVVACGAALILAIVAGTSLMISDFKDRAMQESGRELENTVKLLARHFDRQLADFESIEESLAAEIERRVESPNNSGRCYLSRKSISFCETSSAIPWILRV
jgi:hypothetical protein